VLLAGADLCGCVRYGVGLVRRPGESVQAPCRMDEISCWRTAGPPWADNLILAHRGVHCASQHFGAPDFRNGSVSARNPRSCNPFRGRMTLKADANSTSRCIATSGREVPSRSLAGHLFDHLVGERKEIVGNLHTKGFGGLKIDDELELGHLNNRQIGRLFTSENPSGV